MNRSEGAKKVVPPQKNSLDPLLHLVKGKRAANPLNTMLLSWKYRLFLPWFWWSRWNGQKTPPSPCGLGWNWVGRVEITKLTKNGHNSNIFYLIRWHKTQTKYRSYSQPKCSHFSAYHWSFSFLLAIEWQLTSILIFHWMIMKKWSCLFQSPDTCSTSCNLQRYDNCH